MKSIIEDRIRADDITGDPPVASLIDLLKETHGTSLLAILMYGSYLRGKRGTILDFYVLLDSYDGALPKRWHGWLNRLLPPNVYYAKSDALVPPVYAKYATVRLDQFEQAIKHGFHSYFWARFAQPCALLYVRDDATKIRVIDALEQAVVKFVSQTLPVLTPVFTTRDLWARGLGLSYGCELRAESRSKAANLHDNSADYYAELTAALVRERQLPINLDHDDRYVSELSAGQRARARYSWALRRWQGKALSAARLLKATFTFNDPLDYVLWKIERHSGVYIEPTERQRRYPLIFAWGLLWRIYRKGGFR